MTSTSTDPNAFLMQSGVRPFKFEPVGATAKGPIVTLEMQQQKDIDTGLPETWPNGDPKMQLRIVLATDDRDPEDPDDDGHRAIYVKGQMQAAIRDAIKAASQTQIVEGGILAVKYEKDGERSKPAYSPPKHYRAQYQPPAPKAAAVDADDLL